MAEPNKKIQGKKSLKFVSPHEKMTRLESYDVKSK
ncbi:hypothetical protein ACLK19_06855 [Escherichia coli]